MMIVYSKKQYGSSSIFICDKIADTGLICSVFSDRFQNKCQQRRGFSQSVRNQLS